MKKVSLTQLPEIGVSHNPEIKKKVMLNSNDVPHITNFSQARFAKGQAADAHSHDKMYEVFLFESGKGIIHVNNEEYLIEQGVCVMVEPGEIHEIINTGSRELVVTYFGIKVEES